MKASPLGGPKPQFIDANGNPYSGAKLFFYAAGSSTKQNTYRDSTGATPNSNPIVLDSSGRPTYEIWFTDGLTYKAVLAPSTDSDPPNSPIFTVDNLTGINDVTASVDEWQASGLTPTYVGATSFSVPGDQTATFTAGRRLKSTNTAGTIYSTVASSSYNGGTLVTTVVVVNDSGTLDSGLSAVSLSILRSSYSSLPWTKTSATGLTITVDPATFRVHAAQYAQVQNGASQLIGTVAGTNTITGVLTPTLTAYTAGQTFRFIPAATNTGATTINIDSLGAKNVYYRGAALAGSEIRQNVPVAVIYDGTQFNLLDAHALPAGTASLCGLPFAGDVGTGLFLGGTSILGEATAGTERRRVSATGFQKISNTGSYNGATGGYHEIRSDQQDSTVLRMDNTNNTSPYGMQINFTANTPNNTTNYFISCADSTNQKAVIYSNGTFGSRTNTYGGISDRKLKTDIVPATSQWQDVKALAAAMSKYRFIGDDTVQLGAVAQDWEAISPGLVYETPDLIDDQPTGAFTKNLKWSVAYTKAFKALGEALERIEALESRLAAMDGKNA